MEYQTIIKHLGHQESALVSKCLDAVKQENVSGLSKKDFETAMEAAAISVQMDHPDLTPAKAFVKMLETEAGAKLYDGYIAAGLR